MDYFKDVALQLMPHGEALRPESSDRYTGHRPDTYTGFIRLSVTVQGGYSHVFYK